MGEAKHILSAGQFTREFNDSIFQRAEEFASAEAWEDAAQNLKRQIGKTCMYRFFFEPSTRTEGSSSVAANLLGMSRLGTPFAQISSSMAKGETLQDTIWTANQLMTHYAGGLIVIRHPQDGSAAEAAEVSDVPIINAGDGQNEHPTQAELDLFTIWKHFDRQIDGLHIVFGGDPRYSRTIHSLVENGVNNYPNTEYTFLANRELWIGDELRAKLDAKGVKYNETEDMDDALEQADVFYMTRKQEERVKEPAKDDPEYEAKMEAIVRAREAYERYYFRRQHLDRLKPEAILLHPLPQTGEIAEIPHDHPKVAVGDQMKYGVQVRGALFEDSLLGTFTDAEAA